MERLYFTFGSDRAYPYGREDYVVAIGRDRQDCLDAYKKEYPNRPGSGSVNCAEYYTQAEWEKTAKRYYDGVWPKEIIISGTAYGRKPEGFGPLWLYVPDKASLVFMQEGSGDSLTPEDMAEGNVDYLDSTVYDMTADGEIEEADGGQLLLPYMVQEHYGCLADAIPDVLDFLYGDPSMDAVILDSKRFPDI